jgi:thioredoxin reductase
VVKTTGPGIFAAGDVRDEAAAECDEAHVALGAAASAVSGLKSPAAMSVMLKIFLHSWAAT